MKTRFAGTQSEIPRPRRTPVLSLFLASLVVGLVAAGCAARPQARPNANDRDNAPPRANVTRPPNEARDIARTAATVARRVPGVRQAWAIAVGDVALVGVDLKPGATDAQAVERRVANDVEAGDTRIGRAYVTTDPDLVTRVQRAFQKIEAGRPLSGVWEELIIVWTRLVPQSSDTTPSGGG